jgi:hypothetical protein
MRDQPRNPSGHVPGHEFADTGEPYGLKVALITRVDENTMKADLKILTGGGDRFEVDLTQGMYGPRTFWGGIPEVNSLAIVGYRRRHKNLHEAMILGYIPQGNRMGLRFDPFAPDNPANVDPADLSTFQKIFGPNYRVKRLKMRPGDVGGMSSSGAEFALTKDVRMINRAGDLFELRDTDRTWVGQSVHRVENECGVMRISGPIRRGGFFTYPDILESDGVTLKNSGAERYFGRTVYQNTGPGVAGSASKYADKNGKLLDVFNNTTEFPPVMYSNGRRAYYSATQPAVNFEDPVNGAGALPFVEYRTEVSHTSDMTQEVREEIDGFQMTRSRVYIEHVLGTVVGNDSSSLMGQRQYGRILKPAIFDEFNAPVQGRFRMEEAARSPTDDTEVTQLAGAYYFAVHPPTTMGDDLFAMAVSKQGKFYANIPGSRFERYPSGTKNVSAEINMGGALKMRLGAATPDNIALHLTLEGGAIFDFKSSAAGAGILFRTHSSYNIQCQGVPDNEDLAYSEDIQGQKQSYTTSDSIQNVGGAKVTTVNGRYQTNADRYNLNAHSGYSGNFGEMNLLVSGKTQYNYALAVLENIIAGGRISTIVAGGSVLNVLAGAAVTNVPGGAITETAGAAWAATAGASASINAGASASITAGASFSAQAGASASITAGLNFTATASVAASLVAPQVMLGFPAVLGVSRGAPMMPPGSPSLDWITGLPLQGCAVVRSM